jgi:hypothetical protein
MSECPTREAEILAKPSGQPQENSRTLTD